MKEFNVNSTEYRELRSIANDVIRMQNIKRAQDLKKEHSTQEVARRMGVRESTVRGWLKQTDDSKVYQATNTANKLEEMVKKDRMLDVGKDVEGTLGVSREKLDTALYILKQKGYNIYSNNVPQPTNENKSIRQKILCMPDVPYRDIYDHDKIKTTVDYISKDRGKTFEKKFTYPESMDSRRLMIRYKEQGGLEKDGTIELRRNVPDLSLEGSRYSQVRILVDKTHYIKGMALYSDNMPDGIDVVFNTNKSIKDHPNKLDVLKEIKKDPDNPFGSAIKDADQGGQYWYIDPKTGKKKLGLINKRADEGDWSDWKDTLPSQFLSKQSKNMAKKQLDLAKAEKEDEFSTIMSLTNPTIKKHYLAKFADTCDGAAADLKAAALPNQKYHVIMPMNFLEDNKVYAPMYKDGTKLALIRYPHGGIFEIPILTVDNKNIKARKILPPDSGDAIGINHNVAARLSGADFDGDTVMCIPTHDRFGRVRISSKDELKGLKGFDPSKYEYDDIKIDNKGEKHYYRAGNEFHVMKNTNNEMGKISNLITDMTLLGASDDELARAVRHSMVVIDAEKHKYDYQQSYIDNGIESLKRKWQITYDKDGNFVKTGGASTIVSKAGGELDVPKRRGEPRINIKGKSYYDPNRPEGSLIYFNAYDNKLYYASSKYDKSTGIITLPTTTKGKKVSYNVHNKDEVDKYAPIMSKDPKTGEIIFTNKDKTITYKTKMRTDKTTNMAMVDDAHDLVSYNKHPIEVLYADYANSMKSLANKARIEMVNTGRLQYSSTAAKTYANEVESLNSKLIEASQNSVKERAAVRKASSELKRKKELDPDLKGEELRKVAQRSMTKYREEVGAIPRRERSIKITDKEWEAIQAGAISENKLLKILNNSDPDVLKEKAMPNNGKGLSSSQINRIIMMRNSNFTIKEIAEKMNLSASSISKYLKGV